MNLIRTLFLTTLISSQAFAYTWVNSGDVENPCSNDEQRANFKATYLCQRTDTNTRNWEPSWVCLTLPKDGKLQSITLYTQTSKFFYNDLMNLKLTLPVKNKLQQIIGHLTGSAKDRQSAWDKVKIVLDKKSGKLYYTDTTPLPYAPNITHPYQFNFQCKGSGSSGRLIDDLAIASSDTP